MSKEVFYFTDLSKTNSTATSIKNKVESILKDVVGTTDLKEVEDLSIVFDSFENLDLITKGNFVHYLLEFYFNFSPSTQFDHNLQDGIGRESFKDARELIYTCVDKVEDDVLTPYNDDIDILYVTKDEN